MNLNQLIDLAYNELAKSMSIKTEIEAYRKSGKVSFSWLIGMNRVLKAQYCKVISLRNQIREVYPTWDFT